MSYECNLCYKPILSYEIPAEERMKVKCDLKKDKEYHLECAIEALVDKKIEQYRRDHHPFEY